MKQLCAKSTDVPKTLENSVKKKKKKDTVSRATEDDHCGHKKKSLQHLVFPGGLPSKY